MGHRLTKIYTRTGDDGMTGLADGSRVPKDAVRIEAIGAIDELNSVLGMLLAEGLPEDVHECLTEVQHDLFDLGGTLSIPGQTLVNDAIVARIESALDDFNAALPALENFVLPAGSRPGTLAHVGRAVCRRAERRVATLSQDETTPPGALRYLNRLSDLLFVLARTLNRRAGASEVLWRQRRQRE